MYISNWSILKTPFHQHTLLTPGAKPSSFFSAH
uniref:Uncharacterized protein n=1 Tax=Arundo donax TaxID=35708 RepID=A0A0A9CQH3_ARUDO